MVGLTMRTHVDIVCFSCINLEFGNPRMSTRGLQQGLFELWAHGYNCSSAALNERPLFEAKPRIKKIRIKRVQISIEQRIQQQSKSAHTIY
jgi:hypothetical protein